ncbi:Ig-like domain-containing protein [Eubacterium aggregans]|uniref:Ig-like domain-containing protein n=1 Tax=Eubacterium aggregans TaxID=81409 RepID=UPI003F2E9038
MQRRLNGRTERIVGSWLLLVMLVCLAGLCPVRAEEPLGLVSSSPANKATEVPLNTIIELEFNKNVVSTGVRTVNTNAITLWQNDTKIPVEITMADENEAPDRRNYIIVTPKESLWEGKTYTLHIDTTISARDGSVMAGPAKIAFTTVVPPSKNTGNLRMIIGLVLGLGLAIGPILYHKVEKKHRA